MQGYATKTTIDRENENGTPQGMRSTVAGRKVVYIGTEESGEYVRLNMARMINATGALFFHHEVVMEIEIQMVSEFWRTICWAIGHELNDQTNDVTVETSGESGPPKTCRFDVEFEGGAKWRVTGAALVAIEFTIQPRRLASVRLSWAALDLVDMTGQSVTHSSLGSKRPLSHLDAAVALTTATTWPGDPINARIDPVSGVTVRFERDFAPARFAENGKPSRWTLGHGWRGTGAMTTRLSDSGLWFTAIKTGMSGKVGLLLRPSDQPGHIEIYCDAARFVIPGQDTISRDVIEHQIEWTSYQTPTAAPLKITAGF